MITSQEVQLFVVFLFPMEAPTIAPVLLPISFGARLPTIPPATAAPSPPFVICSPSSTRSNPNILSLSKYLPLMFTRRRRWRTLRRPTWPEISVSSTAEASIASIWARSASLMLPSCSTSRTALSPSRRARRQSRPPRRRQKAAAQRARLFSPVHRSHSSKSRRQASI